MATYCSGHDCVSKHVNMVHDAKKAFNDCTRSQNKNFSFFLVTVSS